jgi:hypothetical protein
MTGLMPYYQHYPFVVTGTISGIRVPCAAVYALPDQFRDRGRSGTPLLWPWPWDLFRGGLSRREELLLGAALMLLAAERLDRRAAPGGEQRLQSVPADADRGVGRRRTSGVSDISCCLQPADTGRKSGQCGPASIGG